MIFLIHVARTNVLRVNVCKLMQGANLYSSRRELANYKGTVRRIANYQLQMLASVLTAG